jgi:hypothetical protein
MLTCITCIIVLASSYVLKSLQVDPEDMVLLAYEKPTEMASYSVSDAVATYYLYEVIDMLLYMYIRFVRCC